MKTRKEQNKILKVGTKDFFIVTNLLHVHLKRNAFMRTEFNAKLTKMEKFCKLGLLAAEKSQKVADKAHQLAIKVDTKGKK